MNPSSSKANAFLKPRNQADIAQANVALISPASRALSSRPPLGLMYLATYNEQHNIPSEVIDIKGNYKDADYYNKLIREMKKINPTHIAISPSSVEVKETRELAERIKKQVNEDAVIVVGGVHATLFPEDFLQNSDIDFVVRNEGEISFSNLILAKDPSSVKGLTYEKNSKIIRTPDQPLMDMNDLPILDFSKVDMDFYTRPSIYLIRGIPLAGFFLFTTRGCPYHCTYCANPKVYGPGVRFRNPSIVGEELQILKDDYKVDGIFFYDDTFTSNHVHVKGICSEFKERKLNIIWGAQTRSNLITDDIVREMKNAGCVQLEFGLETGSERMLKVIKKGTKIEDARRAFSICRKYRMKTFANFMINLPGETEADINASVQLAKEIKPDVTIFNCTTPYPGTELFEMSNISKDEYERMNNMKYNEMMDFINKNCRLAAHNRNLYELEQELVKQFPSIHNLKLNKQTANILFSNAAFLFSSPYLKMLSGSKRKAEYMKWYLRVPWLLKKLYRKPIDTES